MNHYARVGFLNKGEIARTVGVYPKLYRSTKYMPDKILESASEVYLINQEHIRNRTRRADIAEFKHCVRWFMYNFTKLTKKEIGYNYGKFDRTTVINSIDWYENTLRLRDNKSQKIQEMHKEILFLIGKNDSK